MASILTDTLKRDLVQKIFNENEGTRIGDSDNNFYIAIGRSEAWDDPVNINISDTNPPGFSVNAREEREFRFSMQSVKALDAFSWVVPKRDWTSGDTFYQFSDHETVNHPVDQTPYVITEDNNVYLCIKSNKNTAGEEQPSTVKPDHTNSTLTEETDGYIWKFLYSVNVTDANNFMTTAWMPLKYVDSAPADDPYFSQYLVKQAADSAQIVGYQVISGGSGYPTGAGDVTLEVIGNGAGATARASVTSSGVIGHVLIGDSAGVGQAPYPLFQDAMGKRYDYAEVKITANTGSGAIIKPIFSPKNGLGHNPINDLKSNALMFNIKPDGQEIVDGDPKFAVDQNYRQIGLLRNPTLYDSAEKFTATAGLALWRMTLDAQYTGLDFNDIIEENGGDAKGILDWSDAKSPNTSIWYHQNDITTGFTQFTDGDTIDIGDTTGIVADSARVTPDIDPYSGDLLFLANIDPKTRDEDQTEDIKVVIRL